MTALIEQVKFVDNSVTFVDPDDNTKALRIDCVGVTTGNTRVLTVPDSDWTGGTAASIAADDITTGDAAVTIGTTTGNITHAAPSGATIDHTIDSTSELALTAGTATTKSGAAYEITHTATADTHDLTISQTGSFDASLLLTSAGTGTDAISLNASAGGMTLQVADENSLVLGESAGAHFTVNPSATVGDEECLIGNTIGTSEEAINVTATAGGVNIDAAAGKNVTVDGGQVLIGSKDDTASAIALTTNVGTSETIVITNTQGTDDAAIAITASAGGVTIDPIIGSGTTISTYTTHFELKTDTTAITVDQELWTKDVGTTEGTYHVKALVSAIDTTNNRAAHYELSRLFRHDGATTLTAYGSAATKTSFGDTGASEIATSANIDIVVKTATDDPAIEVTPGVTDEINWRGLVTITKAINDV